MNYSGLPLLLLSFSLVSCGPSIHSFQVDQQTITAADSIKVNWEVSGKPTLVIHENEVGGGGGSASGGNGGSVAVGDGGGPATEKEGAIHAKYLELTLVAQKNGKEARQFIQVIVLPPVSVDTIVFPVGSLHGDTLLAAGEKNISRWGDHFRLGSVISASGRSLLVTHGGKTVVLDGQHPDTVSFRDMANSGSWEIRSLLTDAEKRDPTTTPATLRLRTTLIYQKK